MKEKKERNPYLITPEAKRERFRRRAGSLTEKVLERMDMLFDCTNRNSHDWSEAEAAAIVGAIRDRLDQLEKALVKNDIPKRKAFTLEK